MTLKKFFIVVISLQIAFGYNVTNLAPLEADQYQGRNAWVTYSAQGTAIANVNGDATVYKFTFCDPGTFFKGVYMKIQIHNPYNLNWTECEGGFGNGLPLAYFDDWYQDSKKKGVGYHPAPDGGVVGFEFSYTSTFDKVWASYTPECKFPPIKGCRCLKGEMNIKINPDDFPDNWDNVGYIRVSSIYGHVELTAQVTFEKKIEKPKEALSNSGGLFKDGDTCGKSNCSPMFLGVQGNVCGGKDGYCQVELNKYVVFRVPFCYQALGTSKTWYSKFKINTVKGGGAYQVYMCAGDTPNNLCDRVAIKGYPGIRVVDTRWLSSVQVGASGGPNIYRYGVSVQGKGGQVDENGNIDVNNYFSFEGEYKEAAPGPP